MVVFSNMISVGIFVTVTFIVLFSAAAYTSLPLKYTVIVAVPSPTALIFPNDIVATLKLLEI